MNDAGIVMAIIGFVLGSIQYQLRIRLQDTKESMYRVIKYYSGQGETMSIYRILEIMRERLGLNLPEEEAKEYKRCINEWENTHKSLHFWGVKFPLLCLFLYVIYSIVVFYCSRLYVVKP